MKLEDLRDHIDNRMDKFDNKLDNHLERLSKTEEAISWLKGHVKVSTTILITFIGLMITAYLQH